jgi:hypothetical protein
MSRYDDTSDMYEIPVEDFGNTQYVIANYLFIKELTTSVVHHFYSSLTV